MLHKRYWVWHCTVRGVDNLYLARPKVKRDVKLSTPLGVQYQTLYRYCNISLLLLYTCTLFKTMYKENNIYFDIENYEITKFSHKISLCSPEGEHIVVTLSVRHLRTSVTLCPSHFICIEHKSKSTEYISMKLEIYIHIE